MLIGVDWKHKEVSNALAFASSEILRAKKNLSCHCLWGSEEPKIQSRPPKTVRPFVVILAFSHSNLCQLRGVATTLQKKRNGMRRTALLCHPFWCHRSVEKRAEATCVIHHANLVEIGTFEHNAPLSTAFRITMFVQRHRSLRFVDMRRYVRQSHHNLAWTAERCCLAREATHNIKASAPLMRAGKNNEAVSQIVPKSSNLYKHKPMRTCKHDLRI